MSLRDGILGGDTPFLSPSEAPFAFPAFHKATRFMKDGVDHTRWLNLGLLATAWDMVVTTKEQSSFGVEPREFMRQMIAGANTDLQRLGISPLISIDEVERTAPQFASGKNSGKPNVVAGSVRSDDDTDMREKAHD